MLDAIKFDTDVLFYNVFGTAEIEEGQIKVSANIVKSGRPQTRSITEQLETPLRNFSKGFTIPFGAWIDKEDIHLAFGDIGEYDEQTFLSNIETIRSTIKRTVALMKGALL